MKKFLFLLLASVMLFASCDKKPVLYSVTVQLKLDGAAAPISDVKVVMTDGTASYDAVSDATGKVIFSVTEGTYDVTAQGTFFEDGERIAYNGTAKSLVMSDATINVDITKSKSSQIIIKELYVGGCPDNSGTKSYSSDAYVILYNNSENEVDATNTVFNFAAPYNAHGSNKYMVEGALTYENAGWLPAYGAMWWFTSKVVIPAYSQIVVAIFGAIDHTATYSNSVNLAKAEYYWMSNSDVAQYTNAKYSASDVIPASNYLTCSPFTMGNAWALSNSTPAFYIGKMDSATAKTLSQNTDAYDHTLGATAASNVVKFPVANVLDAVEVWSAANIANSGIRFPSSVNTGYVALTNQKGYSLYRNVDKTATEALPENSGKIVYNYSGGTSDIAEGSTDPSGIDAEASIKNGAHIIYSDTNNSATDFHQRNVASLK